MVKSLNAGKGRFCTGKVSRLGVVVMLLWTTNVYPVLAQAPPPEATQPTVDHASVYSMSDLEYLLSPIALYPDPLLALILPASTFPLQIVQAERWLARNPHAVEQGDFKEVDAMAWDPSVQALTRLPDVIKLLADHLEWSESLGMAFSIQPEDVTAAIQLLRAKAEGLGNLKSTAEQVVTTREEGGSKVIYIAPANPERIYVPAYDSSAVFDRALTGALAFGTGVFVGSAWNQRWGWNNRTWNQSWIRPPVWHAPPPGWRPHPGRPGGGRPPGVWRPDRPGTRPELPIVRPERPGGRPERPGVRPERPERPAVRPERPGARPERPVARPERPAARPERPGARPERPVARPERPAARPERPGARPERPVGQRPGASSRPGNITRQGAQPSQQQAGARQAARPQQRARSRQQ